MLCDILNEFQSIIGYKFINEELLIEALTHSSYANENKGKNLKYNERLEFLGDSVLGLIISDYLFKHDLNLPEGQLTKIRAKIVCEPTLAKQSKDIKLGKYLLLGKGEEMTGGRTRPSILADAFEALIGAIYLDRGFEAAREFVLRTMASSIKDGLEGKLFIDYKTHLQEILQNDSNINISYEIIKEVGPDHDKVFYAHVKKNDEVIGYGNGKSKKEAEQNAAKMALERVIDID